MRPGNPLACAQECTVEPVDEANIAVLRRESTGLNIQELESDITASGKVTAEDLELLAILKRADADKNGVVSAHEAFAIFRDDAKVRLCVLGHRMTLTQSYAIIEAAEQSPSGWPQSTNAVL